MGSEMCIRDSSQVRKEKKENKQPIKDEPEIVFKPKILFSDFLDRQSTFEKTKEEHSKKKKAAIDKYHHPQINQRPKELTDRMYDPRSTLERISTFDCMNAQENREYEYYSKFSFVPQTSKHRKKRILPNKKKEEAPLEAPTFRPQINDSNAESEYKDNVMQNIERGIIKKDLFTSALRAREEQKLREECTFQPKMFSQVINAKPAPVAGLHQFLETRKKAKKLAEEQREHKAFGIKSLLTVPQPFALKNRHKSHCELLANDDMKECTFKPATIESVLRGILSNICLLYTSDAADE